MEGMPIPDYTTLGVAGLIAATLAIGLRVVWVEYQRALARLIAMIETYNKLLLDLTLTLEGLKRVIESQEHDGGGARDKRN